MTHPPRSIADLALGLTTADRATEDTAHDHR